MKRRLVALAVFAFVVVALLAYVGSRTGHFKDLAPHGGGACTVVEGTPGPEDITVDAATGVAYVSSVDRRAEFDGRSGDGALYAYPLREPGRRPTRLRHDTPAGLSPHGISLWREGPERLHMAVVNHFEGRHTIELFRVEGDELVHRRTLAGPMLISPNDVVLAGPDELYFTNDHGSHPGVLRVMEDLLMLPYANVVHWNGREMRVVAEGLRYANGIALAPDGGTLYVAAVTSGVVYAYDRDPGGGTLELRTLAELDTGVDNIEVDADGALWIGAHPKLIEFVRHAADGDRPSPSQVLRVRFDADPPTSDEVYLDLGAQLSGSSVAAIGEGRMLIGAVFGGHFLDCPLP